MRFFQELGTLVETRWRDRNYDDSVFPEIAEQALVEMDSMKGADPWDLICKLHQNLELPTQRDDKFSDLVVTLYQGPRFHIAAYYWLDGTTSIHQHAFSGAFQVLLGSSIHSRYSFKEARLINQHITAGQLTLKDIQLLEKGEIRKIFPGRQFIHSLFHLDRPSVTLTIRTNGDLSALPQYDYFPPYFAIDPFHEDRATVRQIQSIRLLLRMGHPEIDAFVGQLVKALDFQTTFQILNVVATFITDNGTERWLQNENGTGRFSSLIEVARQKHGSLVDLLPPVFEELQRNLRLVDQRKYITSAEHRFFLALLLNVPDRARILELVKQRLPSRDPVETICDWLRQLSTAKLPGSQANIVGIEGFDDFYLSVFRSLLQGLSSREIENSLDGEALDRANSQWGGVEQMCDALANTTLFRAIFHDTATIPTIDALLKLDATM
jgi:hypothetical protein